VFIGATIVVEILRLSRALFITLLDFQIFRRLWSFAATNDHRGAMLATPGSHYGKFRDLATVIFAE
jgi:hypothetical protein